MTGRRVFLDTSVFVYSLNGDSPRKQHLAQALIEDSVATRSAVVSYQVVQELLNVMTAKFRTSMSTQDANGYLEDLLWPMCEIHPTAALYGRALAIREKTGWTFYDSLIVAAALAAKCSVLYTEDLQAGRIFEGLEIRNPFAEARPQSPRPSLRRRSAK